LRRRQNEIGEELAQAAEDAKIRRVVFLCSVNAQYASGTGPTLGLHDMEERLNAMTFPELVHLRPSATSWRTTSGVCPSCCSTEFTERRSGPMCLSL